MPRAVLSCTAVLTDHELRRAAGEVALELNGEAPAWLQGSDLSDELERIAYQGMVLGPAPEKPARNVYGARVAAKAICRAHARGALRRAAAATSEALRTAR